MDKLFGVVEDNYAVLSDPWFVPYFVYGYGAGAMTLLLEPLKEHLLKRNASLPRALLKMFVLAVILAAVMETGFGLIINQPDANGVYPCWDNSNMPLNILGQGWLVNDIFIGLVAMVYVWVIFPATCVVFERLSNKGANAAFAVFMVLFALCCAATIYLFYL